MKYFCHLIIPIKYLVTSYSDFDCQIKKNRCSRKVNSSESGNEVADYKSSFEDGEIVRMCKQYDEGVLGPLHPHKSPVPDELADIPSPTVDFFFTDNDIDTRATNDPNSIGVATRNKRTLSHKF